MTTPTTTPGIDPAIVGDGTTSDLAVIIPHYNDTRRLRRCLEALGRQDLTGVEVVVVDNGSTEPLSTIREDHPFARFVTEAEKGAGPARNRGVTETRASVIAFLDADCLPADDWIARARATGGRNDGDLFGGRIDVFDETPPPRSGAEAFEAVFAFDWQGYIEKKGFSVTANLVTRRDVFLDTGPLRNGLSEDLEWCRRATSKGWRLKAAEDLRVSHPSRSDWAALKKKWNRTTREAYEFEGTTARGKWVLKALAMPASAVAHLPKVIASSRLAGPGERARAAGTLFRLRFQRMVWMLRQAGGGQI
ncbi:glycosyltransferase [Haematobacter missouriensis]|uniref:Glycosyltransferase n=1 Tax=Haematobacter missouriensis TaxID=366616 RepID=A0A212ARP3_9RHOB|nr:glycosyltransferase [Haematobacter missouriensis]OWJ84026.1 glycosyltransferase [Haematobacter missouriensis]